MNSEHGSTVSGTALKKVVVRFVLSFVLAAGAHGVASILM
jgi:hypothetical protein